MSPIISPYGSWKSPITADLIGGGEIGLEQIRIDGQDIYWIERRAQEGGRKVIVRRAATEKSPMSRRRDSTPAPAYTSMAAATYSVADGTIVFSNFTDQRLYLQPVDAQPRPLTPKAALRYADGQFDRRRNLFSRPRGPHRARAKPSTLSSRSISTATTAAPVVAVRQ